MKLSFPMPPLIVIGLLMPLLSQPWVVSMVAKTSSRAIPASAGVRRDLYSWPIWKKSLPSSPFRVMAARVSSM